MFDFEEWSEQVFYLTLQLDEAKSAGDKEKVDKYHTDLQKLWDEMYKQEEDEGVQCLKQSLKMSEESIKGDLSSERLNEVMHDMRRKAIAEK